MRIIKKDGRIFGNLKSEFEKLKDGDYLLDIIDINTRSLRQNNALWGWYYPQVEKMFIDSGRQVTIEDIHRFFKYRFLQKRKKCKITKRFRSVIGSTTELSKKGFNEYIEKINIFCIQSFNIGLEHPNDGDPGFIPDY